MRSNFDYQDYCPQPDNHDLDHIPGHDGLPWIGQMIPLVSNPVPTLRRQFERFGPVSRTKLTGQRGLWLLGPEYSKQLMLDSEQIFSSRMGYDGSMGDFFRGGLVTRDFSDHRIHRRIMLTAFKFETLQGYLPAIQSITDRRVGEWAAMPQFRFYPQIKSLLLDIGAQVFMGLELESDIQRINHAFSELMAGSLAVIRKDLPLPWLRYRRGMNGRRRLMTYFRELVPQRRTGEGRDMLSLFSRERDEQGELFDDEVVTDHLVFLLLAAHDTTTSALTMASYWLARHPEWQERARLEANEFSQSEGQFQDLRDRLPIIESIFHETLRMHPPVPLIMRRTVRDTELGGFEVPAHTLVSSAPAFTHYMKEYWSNPDQFDPGRFAPDRREQAGHAFLWVPFGGGAHKCIGLHFADLLFKRVMLSILGQYRFAQPAGVTEPSAIQHFPFAKVIDDLPLVLERIRE